MSGLSKDDINRMAREAGISKPWDQEPVKWETLERFANLIAAAERERCARLCDDLWDIYKEGAYAGWAAIKIRDLK
jgi:hypothetical protein